jgi:protein-S-isoprenylcysteine O-methyltransferase Ste14
VLVIRLRLFRFSPFPRSTATDALGIALCATGIGIAIWARWYLGRNWSVRPSLKEDHDLVTGGPYRFVRHPIYTGLILALLGTAIVTGLTSWIVLVLLTAVFVARIPVEERIMMKAFPDAYPAYRGRTHALIPAIW